MSFERKIAERALRGAEVHPSDEQIARRSYQIWEREGRPQGRHVAHWQMARAELQSELLRRNPADPGRVAQEVYFWDHFG